MGELNRRRKWTQQEIHELALLARARTPVDLIAVELRRTENSIRAIAGRNRFISGKQEECALSPSNRS